VEDGRDGRETGTLKPFVVQNPNVVENDDASVEEEGVLAIASTKTADICKSVLTGDPNFKATEISPC